MIIARGKGTKYQFLNLCLEDAVSSESNQTSNVRGMGSYTVVIWMTKNVVIIK